MDTGSGWLFHAARDSARRSTCKSCSSAYPAIHLSNALARTQSKHRVNFHELHSVGIIHVQELPRIRGAHSDTRFASFPSQLHSKPAHQPLAACSVVIHRLRPRESDARHRYSQAQESSGVSERRPDHSKFRPLSIFHIPTRSTIPSPARSAGEVESPSIPSRDRRRACSIAYRAVPPNFLPAWLWKQSHEVIE